jgi:anaerobic ribonucleoside-triphosphate reductase activating protein
MTELNISHSLTDKLRIAGIVDESIVDGPGIRLVVFTQGCRHNCKGCHNKHTHDFNGGYEISIQDIIDRVKSNPLLDGITLSGGDPFEQGKSCSILAKEVKKLGLSIVTYTGYTYEELLERKEAKDLLSSTDILIDGEFDITKKDLTLPFRGSSNQRILRRREASGSLQFVSGL